jgi:hypothetical protein
MGSGAAADCRAGAAGPRCSGCTDLRCALSARVGGDGSPTPPQCAPVRAAWWDAAARHPLVRYRLMTGLVPVAALATALAAAPAGWVGWAGLTAAALLGLWWSAPRAGAPGWFEVALLALASAACPRDWPLPALAIALAASRLAGARTAAAWAAASAAVAAGAWHAGVHPALPILGLALGAALGALAGQRQVAARREQALLQAIARRDTELAEARGAAQQVAAQGGG